MFQLNSTISLTFAPPLSIFSTKEYIWQNEITKLTWDTVWETEEVSVNEGGASKAREQSVYAEPIPSPAPKAIDAHLVTGLPTHKNQKFKLFLKKSKL